MAASVALALAAPVGVYAAQGVNFDPNGAEAGGPGEIALVSFDWGPGHVLYTGCFGTGALGAGGSCVISAQGHLGSIINPGGGTQGGVPSNVHYTFVMQTNATVTDNTKAATYDGVFDAGDVDTLTFTDETDVTSYFRIYRDQTNDVTPSTGAGYATGAGQTLILEGSVTVNSFSLTSTGQSTENFDQFGSNGLGLITRVTGGTPSFGIQVSFIDTNYFKDPLTSFTLHLDPDIDHTDNSGSPFKNIDPSTSVAGSPFDKTVIGADKVVDIYCGGAGVGPCTGEFQGDAISTFLVENVVPEPGMLALMGLGLAGVGFVARRRQRKTEA
jgi:hypothetical protein